MKKTILAIISVILISMFLTNCGTSIPSGYPYDNTTGNLKYEGVIIIDSINASELFSLINEWVALNYKSAQDVIQLNDNVNHVIILKGNYQTNLFGKQGWYRHTINIRTRDGRFKYIIEVSSYYSSGSGELSLNSSSMGFKGTIFADIDEKVKTTINSLTNLSINKEINKEDDW